MSLVFSIAAPLLRTACAARGRRFRAALSAPRVAQDRVLGHAADILMRSEYGRALGLASHDPCAFRRLVPVAGYGELEPWITRQRRTGAPLLTGERTRMWEMTSGSGGARKNVPYGPSLLHAFASAFRIWADDLLHNGPSVETGRIAISVSPALRDHMQTETGAPIGLADDSLYLPRSLRALVRPFLVWNPELARLRDPMAFRDVAAGLLAADADLEIISVWSPTYLLVLLDHLATNGPRLASELQRGAIEREGIRFSLPRLAPHRAALLGAACADWPALWPHLRLISCWASASAAVPARRLGALFRDVLLQGKGLLATEAPVTVPLLEAPAPVPLADEVFVEVLTAQGDLRRLDELRDGDEGEIVVTVPGGLPRYRLGDRVRAEGRIAATPCLTFIGRTGEVSDLVGEKLDSALVEGLLRAALPQSIAAAILLPRCSAAFQGYALVIDSVTEVSEAELAAQADAALMQAFQYRQARLLGQLAQLQVLQRPGLGGTLQAFFVARGMQVGQVKDRLLVSELELAQALYDWVQAPRAMVAHASAESGSNSR